MVKEFLWNCNDKIKQRLKNASFDKNRKNLILKIGNRKSFGRVCAKTFFKVFVLFWKIITFKIFCPHLAQCGARYCSKSCSQYNLPFSSTKPQSTKFAEQREHVKWSTQ